MQERAEPSNIAFRCLRYLARLHRLFTTSSRSYSWSEYLVRKPFKSRIVAGSGNEVHLPAAGSSGIPAGRPRCRGDSHGAAELQRHQPAVRLLLRAGGFRNRGFRPACLTQGRLPGLRIGATGSEGKHMGCCPFEIHDVRV